MDKETAKKIIQESLPSYLIQKGIQIDRKFLCLNPEHHDHTPSMHYDRRRNRCHCFACGVDADTLSLIQWDYHVDFAEALRIGCDLFGLDTGDGNPKKKPKIKPAKQGEWKPHSEIKKADIEVRDKVYRTMKKLMPLTEKDKTYLRNVRHLPEARIQEDYLRLVTDKKARKLIVRKLQKLTGYSKEILKYVPGFFIDKNTGNLDYIRDFDGESNYDGIGILIHDAFGKISAIQIRRDTTEKGSRYCWFTSIFAVDNPDYDGGSTPGAEKDILIPDKPKKCLCITEGRFKSELLVMNHNITISIQGVSAWRGIDEIIKQLKEHYELTSIYLMFDSDILGNRQVYNNIINLVKQLERTFPEMLLRFGVWKISYGKGIDDCINNGHMQDVKFIPASYFMNVCEHGFQEKLKELGGKSVNRLKAEDRKKFGKELQKKLEKLLFEEERKDDFAA